MKTDVLALGDFPPGTSSGGAVVQPLVYRHEIVFGEFSEEEERCGAYLSPTEGLHSAYTFVLLLARKLTSNHQQDGPRFP